MINYLFSTLIPNSVKFSHIDKSIKISCLHTQARVLQSKKIKRTKSYRNIENWQGV